jgi:hypothetical protein
MPVGFRGISSSPRAEQTDSGARHVSRVLGATAKLKGSDCLRYSVLRVLGPGAGWRILARRGPAGRQGNRATEGCRNWPLTWPTVTCWPVAGYDPRVRNADSACFLGQPAQHEKKPDLR